MEIRKSPGRIPAWAAGELVASFQACGPLAVSIQATPSSGVSKVSRWTKFSQAKIMAASVARARTTAPRLTRRFCFMAKEETPLPLSFKVQTNVHYPIRSRTKNRNVFLRLGLTRGAQAARIHFMEGCLQLSKP